MTKVTREEIMEIFYPERKRKPLPPDAVKRAAERWAQPKPLEAVVRDEAAANAALLERLRRSEAEEYRRQNYQSLIDGVWAAQRAFQADLRELAPPSYHRGPGDPDWR